VGMVTDSTGWSTSLVDRLSSVRNSTLVLPIVQGETVVDTATHDSADADEQAQRQKGKPIRRRMLIAALVLVGLIAVVVGIAGNPVSPGSSGLQTVAASLGDVNLSVSASGVLVDEFTYSLSPGQSATLTAKGGATLGTGGNAVGYKTTTLYVREGDSVKKNQKIARAKDSLGDYHTVRTPVAGQVRSISTAVGAAANQVAIIGAGKKLVSVSVSEYDISGVTEGLTVELTLGATKEVFAGTVYRVGELADNSTGVQTYTVLVESDELPSGARIGMSVTAAISVNSAIGVVTVPVSALTTTGDTTTVTVLNSRAVPSVVTVTLGLVGDSVAEVTSGLNAGDKVVVGTSGSVPAVTTGFGSGSGAGPGGN
jgi:multidrug efflux pump subunit AcrA (membrane-fusion protein)